MSVVKRSLLLAFLAVAQVATVDPASRAAGTPVFVLGTLYKRHEGVPGYDLPTLRKSILAVEPDVLVLDVTPQELREQKVSPGKIEYPGVIFPLMREGTYRVYHAEPDEPMFSEIVQSIVQARRRLETEKPDVAAAMNQFEDAAYAALKPYWRSPAQVNSAVTDAVLAGKQALEGQLVGPAEADGGERWVAYAAERVQQAVKENPGKRVLVLAGVHNRDGLNRRLRTAPGVDLVEMQPWLEAHVP